MCDFWGVGGGVRDPQVEKLCWNESQVRGRQSKNTVPPPPPQALQSVKNNMGQMDSSHRTNNLWLGNREARYRSFSYFYPSPSRNLFLQTFSASPPLITLPKSLEQYFTHSGA